MSRTAFQALVFITMQAHSDGCVRQKNVFLEIKKNCMNSSHPQIRSSSVPRQKRDSLLNSMQCQSADKRDIAYDTTLIESLHDIMKKTDILTGCRGRNTISAMFRDTSGSMPRLKGFSLH
ncbi:hypothetical protein CEXT_743221 [Caerostris extrusa]|uniref:Uncharacterized protein n=1 Tax=Caerostris extrusa TaxID=172846 RepID=A0AAV4QNT7_CAEEX|nr:hypothetical protein CEXT_743221 [Caerostris extrusa]